LRYRYIAYAQKKFTSCLQQTLGSDVNKSQLTHDDELQRMYDRLLNLDVKVEYLKNKITKTERKQAVIYSEYLISSLR
jgi:hypothetical protein